ncbi:MAG: hypothetical protein HRT81_18155, partial [Henriciella sp.]|nr:hypothetical protein [Henriciella sp.]
EIASDDKKSGQRYADRDASESAFDRAIQLRPRFLDQILALDLSEDDLIVALRRLAELPFDHGAPIWSAHKSMVFDRLPNEGFLLAVLSDAFDDVPGIDRAASLLHRSKGLGTYARVLAAKARRDPEGAFDLLEQHGLCRFEYGSHWWLHELITAMGDEGQARLVQLAETSEDGVTYLTRCLLHAPYLANAQTLTSIATDAMSRLAALREDGEQSSRPIANALKLLSDADPGALQAALSAIDTEKLFDHLLYFFSGKDPKAWRHDLRDIDFAIRIAFAAEHDIAARFVAVLLEANEPHETSELLKAASIIVDDRIGEALVRLADRWTKQSGALGAILVPLIAQSRFRKVFELLMGAKQLSWTDTGIPLPTFLSACADRFTDSERQRVLDALDALDATNDDDRRRRLISLIKLLKIKAGEPILRLIVENSNYDNTTRIFAANSLIGIGAGPEGLEHFALQFLLAEKNNSAAFKEAAIFCVTLNNPRSKRIVRNYFKAKTDGSFSSTESQLLGWLAKDDDLETLEALLAENNNRFAREELESLIRNAKARIGDVSTVPMLADQAMSPVRGFFGRTHPDYALKSLIQIKPETALDIAANNYRDQRTADHADRLWSIDPQKTLDLLFEELETAPKTRVIRLNGRYLVSADVNVPQFAN